MSLYNFDTYGMPLNSAIRVKGHPIIVQTIITTFVFLIIILWFTLAFNLSTRGQNETDYYFLQFAVYFTIFAIIIIYILYIQSIYVK